MKKKYMDNKYLFCYCYLIQSTSMKTGGSETSHIQIEKLPFYNHTECECQDRSDEMPRDKEQLSSNSISSQYNLDPANRNV